MSKENQNKLGNQTLNERISVFCKMPYEAKKLHLEIDDEIGNLIFAHLTKTETDLYSIFVGMPNVITTVTVEQLKDVTEDDVEASKKYEPFIKLVEKFIKVFPSFKIEEGFTNEDFNSMIQLMVDQQLLVQWASKEEQENTKQFIDWSNASQAAQDRVSEKISEQTEEVKEEDSKTEDVVDSKVKEETVRDKKSKRDPHKTRPMFNGRVPA